MKGQETYGDMEEKQSSREGILDPSENNWSDKDPSPAYWEVSTHHISSGHLISLDGWRGIS